MKAGNPAKKRKTVIMAVMFAVMTALTAQICSAADTTPPEITSALPSGKFANSDITLEVRTDENASCRYGTSDTAYSSMTGSLSAESATLHTRDIGSLPDGNHIYYSRCNDTSGNVMTESAVINFTIDTTPPAITSYEPRGTITTSSTVFTVLTNETSECRFDTTSGKSFSSMNRTFDTSNSTNHSTVLEGLTDGTYHYYVKCRDEVGNTQGDYDAAFTVDISTTAEITLSDPSPVKEGIIKVTLVTSKNMQHTPSLSYTLSDAPPSMDVVTRSVPLSGSGNLWKGYMAIAKSDHDRIGEFKLVGTDINGDQVTTIKSGSVFVVDTHKPPIVESIQASAEPDGCIKLEWYYDGEEPDHFGIYRSTSSGVEKIHLFDETEDEIYYDCSAVSRTTYYYKVSVTDMAGNEGDLSVEVKETAKVNGSEPGSTSEEPDKSQSGLSAELQPAVDSYLRSIDSLIEELEKAKKDAKDYSGSVKDASEYIGFENRIDKAIAELENLNDKAKRLKERDLSRERLEDELDSIDSRMTELEESTPVGISIKEKIPLEGAASEESFMSVMKALFDKYGLDRDKYNLKGRVKESMNLQDMVSMESEAIKISMEFLDSSTSTWTMVSRKISVKPDDIGHFNNTLVAEALPKEEISTTGEINSEERHIVIKEDPMLAWKTDFSKDSQLEFSYYAEKDFNPSSASSMIIVDPTYASEDKGLLNSLTGLITYENMKKPGFYTFMLIIIIIGLLAYYLFFLDSGESRIEPKESSQPGKGRGILGGAAAAITSFGKRLASGSRSPSISRAGDDYLNLLMSNEAVEEYSSAGLESLKDNSFREIFEKADTSINNLDFDSASRAYFIMISKYNSLQEAGKLHLVPDLDEVHDLMNRVYDKLMLHARIREAEAYSERGDYVSLRHVLNRIADLYNKMVNVYKENDSRLLTYARETHSANSLRIINNSQSNLRQASEGGVQQGGQQN